MKKQHKDLKLKEADVVLKNLMILQGTERTGRLSSSLYWEAMKTRSARVYAKAHKVLKLPGKKIKQNCEGL